MHSNLFCLLFVVTAKPEASTQLPVGSGWDKESHTSPFFGKAL